MDCQECYDMTCMLIAQVVEISLFGVFYVALQVSFIQQNKVRIQECRPLDRSLWLYLFWNCLVI